MAFGSAEIWGAALPEPAGLSAGRVADFAGRGVLAEPAAERFEPGAADGGRESRGAASVTRGVAAEARPSSGDAAWGGALGRKANTTITAKIRANAAVANSQIRGTAARWGGVRSLAGGALSRARSTRIVTAGELLRLERTRASTSVNEAEAGPCGVQSAEGCTLRLANGSR